MRHWISALVLVAAGCSPSGPQALMDSSADVRMVPWPSDALLGPDGKLHVAFPLPFDSNVEQNLMQLAETLSTADGFSTTRSIFFPVSADITVDDGATATVVDLDDPSKTWAYPLFYRADAKQLVAMAPLGTALLEHHQYGCYIKAGVHGLHASSTMGDAIGGHGKFGALPAYQKLAKLGLSGVVAATAFTTQTLSAWAQKATADLAAMPPKVTVDLTFTSAAELDAIFGGAATTTKPGRPPAGGVLHDAVAGVVVGHFDSPHYLSPTPGTLGLFDDAMTVKATDHIPYILVVPTRASYANVPLVIFQHGIDGDRSAALLVANSYAKRGYATLGIDELWHGSRLPGNVDNVYNLSGAAGHDGIGDPSSSAVSYFFDFQGDKATGALPVDPRYIRDNFRQAAIDLMQEVRLAKIGDLGAVAGALPSLAGLSFDGSKVVYSGESFGSIMGAVVLAVDPELDAAVLDVGGGGLLIDLVPNSAQFGGLLQPFVQGAFDNNVDTAHPDVLPIQAQMSLNMLQEVIEPGDGLALAATPGAANKQALFLFAYGDETVPNQSNQSLARAWGASEVALSAGSHPLTYVMLPPAHAPYTATPLRAAVQLDPASHGMFTGQSGESSYVPPFPPFMKRPMPIMFDNPIVQAHALALGFIDGIVGGGGAAVVDAPTSN